MWTSWLWICCLWTYSLCTIHIDDYNADLALKTYVLSKKRLYIKKIWKIHYARLLGNIFRHARRESLDEIPLCTFIKDCTFIRETRADRKKSKETLLRKKEIKTLKENKRYSTKPIFELFGLNWTWWDNFKEFSNTVVLEWHVLHLFILTFSLGSSVLETKKEI